MPSHSASTSPPQPVRGDVLAGKYRIERVIGEGGMGTVLAAHHELLGVNVAVKLLSPELVKHTKIVERFVREARAVARLRSEHVARVMDVGKLDDGRPYIVMELLEGSDLERLLKAYGPLPVDRTVDCMLQTLEAMAHAHAAGIVHRDLKPANLFITRLPDGRDVLKVLDFGVAKTGDAYVHDEGHAPGSLTGEQSVLGSPSYMAPEQVRNARDVDFRADLWAIGTIMYELLTGRVAFGGYSTGEIFSAVLEKTPPSPRTIRPQIPAPLDVVIMKCLAKEVTQRPPSVSALARVLAPFGSGRWSSLVPLIEQTLASGKRTPAPDLDAGGSAPGLQDAPTRDAPFSDPVKRAPPPLPAEEELEEIEPDEEEVPDEALSVPPPPATSPGADAPVVLVCDDDESIRALVTRALGTKCTVYEATNGEEAWELLQKIPNPDALVCDVTMPKLDGYALGKRIKADARLRAVPIVFLTAKSSALDVVQAINSGARHHVPKPFKVMDLLDKLSSAMGRPGLWRQP